MPIRFRCAYCNQLLGIARRKSGTVVRCPTCAGQVVVPNADAPEVQAAPGQADPLVFERNDFDDLLQTEGEAAVPIEQKGAVLAPSQAPVAAPSAAPPPGAWGTHAEPAFDVERINPVPPAMVVAEAIARPEGIFLSPRRVTLLAVAGIVVVTLAFVAGLLLGYSMRPALPESQPESRNPSGVWRA